MLKLFDVIFSEKSQALFTNVSTRNLIQNIKYILSAALKKKICTVCDTFVQTNKVQIKVRYEVLVYQTYDVDVEHSG